MGDAIMFSSGIRDFKLLFPDIRINVDSNQPYVFENNPYIDNTLTRGENVEYYRVGYPAVGSCNNTNIHFTQMFLLDMIAIADHHHSLPMSLGEFTAAFANGEVGDPCYGNPEKNDEAREPFITLKQKYTKFCKEFSRQRGDIHLTDKEKEYNLIKDIYKIDKYWVISPGGKRDCTTKIWDWRKFQSVINYFKGRITFVVIGKSDLLIEKFKDVIDLTDKFNKEPRGLFPLAYHAEGCVSGPSALMHIAAALPPKLKEERRPCVSIFGGREPIGWSWYTNHQILHTNGAFDCCSAGGCWTARTYPLPKSPKHNKSLCKNTIQDDGRTVQACMMSITSQDVIRAIEKYYEGNLYTSPKHKDRENIMPLSNTEVMQGFDEKKIKKINLLGNLHTRGGGEQSLMMIAKVLQLAGWEVHILPFQGIHSDYDLSSFLPVKASFLEPDNIEQGIPLLYYANDTTRKFAERSEAQIIVEKSSDVIIGINYMNTPLPKCDWLAKSGKVRGIIFQNQEKKSEWIRDQIGFDNVKYIINPGAINLDTYLEVCTKSREKNDDLVILKHCVADYRKYMTKDAEGKGEKIHIWQKHIYKECDVRFYTRMLKDNSVKNTKFMFMEAHKELMEAFPNHPRMVFYKWNQISVSDFLSKGHIYLYRTSNLWRDQYPRVVGEALAAGLPVLSEPRDGTYDRIIHGDTGFYCIDYDGFVYALKLLQRKENYRQKMGQFAKDWAKINLDPRSWVNIIEKCLQ